MTLSPRDQHHPNALRDCQGIASAVRSFNAIEHGHALASLAAAFDRLFTTPGVALKDFCTHVPGSSDPKFFLEPFYGGGDEGVVAAFAETAQGRPVLLSVVSFKGPGPGATSTRAAAKVMAMRAARRRARDL